MQTPTPGRRRHGSTSRPGDGTRGQILDAGAELFTTLGFASTSTRQIAEAVGIRQASLYYHFATKEEILDVLLAATLSPALSFAEALGELEDPGPVVRLHALARYDAGILLRGRWNTGALYLLPEVRTGHLRSFQDNRLALFERYRELSRRVVEEIDGVRGAEVLTFHLVESIVTQRTDAFPGVVLGELELLLADTCLRALGHDPDPTGRHEVHEASAALVERLAASLG